MIVYTKQEAISRMNHFGMSGEPFLFCIDYKQERIFVEKPELINPGEFLYDLNGLTNTDKESHELLSSEIKWKINPVSFEEYTASFDIVSRNIHAGNSYLVNLTSETQVQTNLSLEEIFYHSIAKYKFLWKEHFVVFSPEIFVRISDDVISSYPMKGTIDASLPDANNRIMNDPKEAAEHATIVDLIRNDLSMVATGVSVPRFRYIDELRTNSGYLLQVSSEVKGFLPDDWRLRVGTILFSLLPAGSITGAPKKKTVQIIEEAETYERGFYTGIMGYFDGFNLDSAVMIRFIEQRQSAFYFKSGGGITSQSNVSDEYNEMKQKVYVPIY
ncbi:aminodeoxychorismate synthase component I [Parabacteroides chinchillae]